MALGEITPEQVKSAIDNPEIDVDFGVALRNGSFFGALSGKIVQFLIRSLNSITFLHLHRQAVLQNAQ